MKLSFTVDVPDDAKVGMPALQRLSDEVSVAVCSAVAKHPPARATIVTWDSDEWYEHKQTLGFQRETPR